MRERILVPIQANATLVKNLKMLAVSQNRKIYELVDEALFSWLQKQHKEFEDIQNLMIHPGEMH